ncbi:DinB family protein [Chryseolinea sp. T2]|uniref:DinB family protein n=1 Tax=Chryseolinea sp. T2 TaxID=3129255 RepID=UPI0030771F07
MAHLRNAFVLLTALALVSCADKGHQNGKLKESLLQQLKNSNSDENWFAPIHVAVTGVTAEQASWRDTTENHSIGQLASHLAFWNERVLKSFQGNKPPDFQGSNDSTFRQLDERQWSAIQTRLDSIQKKIEEVVSNGTDEQLEEWAPTINNLCMHNAYHTGQMVYIRKRNGWWRAHS